MRKQVIRGILGSQKRPWAHEHCSPQQILGDTVWRRLGWWALRHRSRLWAHVMSRSRHLIKLNLIIWKCSLLIHICKCLPSKNNNNNFEISTRQRVGNQAVAMKDWVFFKYQKDIFSNCIHLFVYIFLKDPSSTFLTILFGNRVLMFSSLFLVSLYNIPLLYSLVSSGLCQHSLICLHLSYFILQRSLEIFGIYAPLSFALEFLTGCPVPKDPSSFTYLYWQIDIGFLIDFTEKSIPKGSTLLSLKKAQLSDMQKAFLNYKMSPKTDIGSALFVEKISLYFQSETILFPTVTSETGLLLLT